MSPSSTPPPGTSYTQMYTNDHDLDAIGAHCQFEYCNLHDFLPFRCESCKHTYCLDHRSETAHKCKHAGEWAARRRQNSLSRSSTPASGTLSAKPTVLTGQQCSSPTCKTFINTIQSPSIHCQTCNRHYCLKHRMREDHACSTLKPIGARPGNANPLAQQAEAAKSAFAKLRSWGQNTTASLTPKPKPKPASVRLAAVAALKKTAKGDPKVPLAKRVYLRVEAEASTTTSKFPKGEFFFSPDWSVGRVLDDSARRLQVANVNNKVGGEEEKLRVFHVEGGRLLEFQEKIGAAVTQGDTIVLLRGAGPACPDLIELGE